MRKKTVLHITTLMHCKTRQILHALFNTNQRNSLEKTFVAWSYKSQPQKFET